MPREQSADKEPSARLGDAQLEGLPLTPERVAITALELGLSVSSIANWNRARRDGRGRGGCSEATERRIVQKIVELGFVR